MNKHNLIAIPLCLVLTFAISGCAHETNGNGSSELVSGAKEAVAGAVRDATNEVKETLEPQQVSAGEAFTIPNMFEITLDSAEWRDDVSFKSDGFSTTFEHERDGVSFFLITGKAKNICTEKESVGSDGMAHLSAKFNINGTYSIDANIIVDRQDGSVGFEIDPMMTENIVIYGMVSDEIREEFESCEVTLEANQTDEDGYWHTDARPVGEYVALFH